MKRTTATVAFVAAMSAASSHAATRDESATTGKTEITALVQTFQDAIARKDGEGLKALFLPQGSNWWSVLDDDSYAAVRSRRAEAVRAQPGDLEKFARFISTSNKATREDFSHVRIETDGLVGTVYFDYAFFLGGRQTNHGVETWQLLKTDAGWRISGLVYSERDDK